MVIFRDKSAESGAEITFKLREVSGKNRNIVNFQNKTVKPRHFSGEADGDQEFGE